eukprot:1156351-Pelagomonas_calceolata.AAC.17
MYIAGAAPAIHSLLAPLRQSAADLVIHQRLPHPHTKAGGAGPSPHRVSKLPCLHLSIYGATHIIVKK